MLINHHKWVKENYNWLIKWFDDCESVEAEELKGTNTHCQQFVDTLYRQKDYDRILRGHIMTILTACIWGTYFKRVTGNTIFTGMDGFYKLKGRLPLPSDKVGIRYYGSDKKGIRMLRFNFDSYPLGKFFSDCRLNVN